MPAIIRPVGHLKSMVNEKAEVSVPSGISIREALLQLEILPELVALVVINGEHQADKDTVLNDGDVVKLMAVIGGG
jgi:sulfur carrier protein ThiS